MYSSTREECTKNRVYAPHAWPVLNNAPCTLPMTAASMSASAHRMLGALPPSSRVVRLKSSADARAMYWPTSVEPVNEILSTPRWLTSALPTSGPPVSRLTTPAGTPASRQISTRRTVDSGVCSAGLRMTALPVARAGASFHAAMASGKFHGVISAHTPSGTRRWYVRLPGIEIGDTLPSILVAKPA